LVLAELGEYGACGVIAAEDGALSEFNRDYQRVSGASMDSDE
jgi:hypothetical protein